MEQTSEAALVCGARSGKFPLRVAAADPDRSIIVHVYDRHPARKVREDLDAAGRHDIEVICSAHLPHDRAWPLAYLFRDDRAMSGELQLDCVQEIRSVLADGGELVTDVPRETVSKVFGKAIRPLEDGRGLCAVKRGPEPERVRKFTADWPASVPGGPTLTFTSLPGCFCHRRADAGGLALAEVVARETKPAPHRILDMGCGCGLAGILVADALRRKGGAPELTLLDSHTRAIEAARINAERHGIDAQFVLADDGLASKTDPKATAPYDIFLGNPPYFGDWSIAELFLKTAEEALGRGGECWTVAKNGEGLLDVQKRFFPDTQVFSRRGYTVLRGTQRRR